MYSNFTKIVFFTSSRKKIISSLLLILLWVSYLPKVQAQVIVTPTNKSYTLSADKAVGGPNAGFTALGDVVITETKVGDFSRDGKLVIISPISINFKNKGINVSVDAGAEIVINNSTVTVTDDRVIIPFKVLATNEINSIRISGLEIQSDLNKTFALRNIMIGATPNDSGASPINGIEDPEIISNKKLTVVAKVAQVAGAPVKLSFTAQPGAALVNESLSTQPKVAVVDAADNKIISPYFNTKVTLSITPSTNPYNAALANNKADYLLEGAVFSGVSINESGKYTLTASLDNLTGVSNEFIISNKTPVISQVQGCVFSNAATGEITVNGQGFARVSKVSVNGQYMATRYVNSQQLIASLTAESLASTAPLAVSVFTEGTLLSGIFNFTPTATISAGNDMNTDCTGSVNGTSFTLANATAPEGTYAWTFINGSGIISDAAALNPTVQVKSNVAKLRLTVKTAEGCTFSDEIELKVNIEDEYIKQEPLLISKQTDVANNTWKISLDETQLGNIRLGTNSVYMWYTSNTPDEGWGEPVLTTTTNDFVLVDPPIDLKVEARILNSESCQLYIFGFGQATPLPVELMGLKAVKQGNDALITWATAMERNNAGFDVEVSVDGLTYRSLGFVATKNGDASIKQEYTYKDKENGKHGSRYYRIKQIDTDGVVAYYGPREVLFEDVRSQVKAYPNPFIGELKVDIAVEHAQEVRLTIHDMLGKVITTRSMKLEKGVTSDMFTLPDNLPRGLYILQVQQGNLTKSVKLVKE